MNKAKWRFKWIRAQQKLKTWIGVPEDRSWDYVIDKGFDQLAILPQSGANKAEISKRILEGVETAKIYWLEVILAALIATFGLLQNSVAVIIGAMLIAPLLRPIQGLAYGIVIGRASLFWQASKILILSIILSIGIPIIVLYFIPTAETTPEILGRTQPNLFDLLIAVFSAVIAILAHAHKRLYESVAGVAMATALMPPLVVIGLQIAWGNFDLAWGATLLFMTNLVAILVVGAVLFIFYGFNPHRSQAESSAGKIGFLFFMVIVLWTVLSVNWNQIQEQRTLVQMTQETFEMIIEKEMPGAKVRNLNLRNDEDTRVISGTFYVPESTRITRAKFNKIESQLIEDLGQDVYLELDLIRTVSFEAEESKTETVSE